MDGDTDAVMLADLTLTRILRAHLEGDGLADEILRRLDEKTARLVLAIAITRLAESSHHHHHHGSVRDGASGEGGA
jgi:hypothetical protein